MLRIVFLIICSAICAKETTAATLLDEQIKRHEAMLLHYAEQEKKESIPLPLTCDKLSLELGDAHPAMPMIRKHLSITGDLKDQSPVDPLHYDEHLQQAVQNFQTRNFMDADGVLGTKTCQTINQNVIDRVKKLQVNLSRLRELREKIEKDAVLVNLATYELFAIRNHETDFTMKTIVGRPARKTPFLTTQMSQIVFNPTWTVPPTILYQDKLKKIRKDPSYIERQNFRLYDVDGHQVSPEEVDWSMVGRHYFPYRLTQKAGKKNALGPIKFIIENSGAIYLHGTNEPKLFSEEMRALSSGCIRLEQPSQLATWLVRYFSDQCHEEANCSKDYVNSQVQKGETRTFKLRTPIKTYLIYITTWIHDDGMVYFSNDPYNLDPKAMISQSNQL